LSALNGSLNPRQKPFKYGFLILGCDALQTFSAISTTTQKWYLMYKHFSYFYISIHFFSLLCIFFTLRSFVVLRWCHSSFAMKGIWKVVLQNICTPRVRIFLRIRPLGVLLWPERFETIRQQWPYKLFFLLVLKILLGVNLLRSWESSISRRMYANSQTVPV
jgi:hypothetical protein